MSKFLKFFDADKIKLYQFSTIIILVLIAICSFMLPPANAAIEFILRSSQQVYLPGDSLVLYGAAAPNETLVIRLYDPSGLAVRIDNIKVDEDGFFRKTIFEWPEPSRNLPFGSYTVQAISSVGNKDPQQVEIAFAEGVALEGTVTQFPKSHDLAVKLDAPAQVALNTDFRIFVQVTYDNALVDAIDEQAVLELMGSSHIHSSNSTVSLSESFKELHPGLYYADVRLQKEDAYIIHAGAFYKGFLSHDSRVISASGVSIGTIQQSVDELNLTLLETRHALNDTKSTITESVENARTTIRDEIEAMSDASGQINALILPVLALISVIIALQISLFARIRASYR